MATENPTEAAFGESRLTDELGDRGALDLSADALKMAKDAGLPGFDKLDVFIATPAISQRIMRAAAAIGRAGT